MKINLYIKKLKILLAEMMTSKPSNWVRTMIKWISMISTYKHFGNILSGSMDFKENDNDYSCKYYFVEYI